MIIAIDGPAGAGKSTVAKILAKKLDCTYINTGAMYRAVALKFLKVGGKLSEKEIKEILENTDINLKGEKIFLDDTDVSEEVKDEKVAKFASKISQIPIVRQILVEKQRKMAEKLSCVVMEGRDIGTVVFPNAEVKIFLTASAVERAKRRYEELKERGFKVSYEHILQKIKERDKQDMERKIAPLKPTKEHIIIDTTDKSIDDVVSLILQLVKKKQEGNNA
jgi:cytidylate kinase